MSVCSAPSAQMTKMREAAVGAADGNAVGAAVVGAAVVGAAVFGETVIGDCVGLLVGALLGVVMGEAVEQMSPVHSPLMQSRAPSVQASRSGQGSHTPPPQSTSVSPVSSSPFVQSCTDGVPVGALVEVGALVGEPVACTTSLQK